MRPFLPHAFERCWSHRVRIELLISHDCPNAGAMRDLVRTALSLENVDNRVDEIRVDDAESAQRMRFLGSPSLRIDGDDIELSASRRTAYGLMCRTYRHGALIAGVPPIEMLRAAIRRGLTR
jgi:hypothetical protein